MTSLWWIRRDLRLTDNLALQATLEAGPVLPVFVIDPAFARASPRRKDFLYEGLHALDKDLQSRDSSLVVRSGKPLEALPKYRVSPLFPAVERDRERTLQTYKLAGKEIET